jgi:hypothetical protein
MRRPSSFPLVSLVTLSLTACHGGVATTTTTPANANATNTSARNHTITVTANGPRVQVARTAPSGSAAPDSAPTLLTLRARGGARIVATNGAPRTVITPAPGSAPTPPATPTTAMPSEGGYIVRGTGGATRTTAAPATLPTTVSPPAPVAIATPRGEGPTMHRTTRARPASGNIATASGGGTSGGAGRGRFGDSHGHAGAGYAMAGDESTVAIADGEAAPSREVRAAPRDRASVAQSAPMGGGYAGAPAVAPMPTPVRPPPPTNITVSITTPPPGPPPVIVAPVAVDDQAPVNLLTAASVGDSDRRENYLAYLSRHGGEAESLGLDMSRRVRFRVIDANGRPVDDAEIALSGEGLQAVAHTHNDGTWDFFPSVAAGGWSGRANARITVENVALDAVVDVPPSGDGPNVVVQLPAVVAPPQQQALDLQFLIDVTGSMGDELRYVNREVGNIVQRIEAASPGTHVRVGATFYRDRSDEIVVQQIPFTTNVAGFAMTMQQVVASGGGDYPEDMNAGLEAALTGMAWTEGPATRVLVVIADAPPQPYADENFTWTQAMLDASRRGIRVLPVAASGADRTVEFLFRAMGTMTTTPYVYLTDESGIGAPHMEADTDRVAVERFNDLLTRMVISDVHGEGMHEPVPAQI